MDGQPKTEGWNPVQAIPGYALRLGKIFTDYIDKDVACAKNLEVGVKNRTFIMEVCCI